VLIVLLELVEEGLEFFVAAATVTGHGTPPAHEGEE
jgi:hypothetical protein